MNQLNKKILVAVDGSSHSFNAVQYVSRVLSPQITKITLFHVMRKIDQTFWDIGSNPLYHHRINEIDVWNLQLKEEAEEFMKQSREVFLDSGFPENSVRAILHKSEVGIARDIIRESRNGYSAVVLGRKGTSNLKDLIFGSVAFKILEKVAHIPVWVVGSIPSVKKVLLCVDASDGSRRATEYVGTMLGDSNSEVTLLHVIGGQSVFHPEKRSISIQDELMKIAKNQMERIFEELINGLTNSGMNTGQINTKVIMQVTSRAAAIVDEAKRGRYGTIVMGRRGISKVEEFFMGRVTNKVLHLSKSNVVWVVN